MSYSAEIRDEIATTQVRPALVGLDQRANLSPEPVIEPILLTSESGSSGSRDLFRVQPVH
jgi:hypothetical protein